MFWKLSCSKSVPSTPKTKTDMGLDKDGKKDATRENKLVQYLVSKSQCQVMDRYQSRSQESLAFSLNCYVI